MSCNKFCFWRRILLQPEDSEWLRSALQIFLAAHRLLTNFIRFFKLHARVKCCGINYDAVPLHGALDILPLAIASIFRGNVLKKGEHRPGLFQRISPCVKCRDTDDLPPYIARKVDVILTSLQQCCAIEDIICEIKNVLCTLEKMAPCAMSERLQILAALLKEIMKKLICFDQRVEEPPSSAQTKLTLNLANNFIRDWSEKTSATRPCLKFCRFCDSVVSESSRQWGMFCCNEAQQFTRIVKEWFLRQSISESQKSESLVSCYVKSNNCRESKSEMFSNFLDEFPKSEHHFCTCKHLQRAATSCSCDTAADRDKKEIDARFALASRRGNADEENQGNGEIKVGTFGEISGARSERIRRENDASRGEDKFDKVEEGRDLRKMATRGESVEKRSNIDGNDEYPIAKDGREKRDDVPYKTKLGEIRGSLALRDASVERRRGGETREIKNTKENSSEWRKKREDNRRGGGKFKGEGSERNFYNRVYYGKKKKLYRNELPENKTRKLKKGGDLDYNEEAKASSKSKKRNLPGKKTSKEEDTVDDDKMADAEISGRKKKKKKLYRNELSENRSKKFQKGGDFDYSEEDKSSKSQKRNLRGKKTSKEEENTSEDSIIVDAEISGRRRKKKDAFDNERGEFYGFDEERKVGKRKGRSWERNESDFEFGRKAADAGGDRSTIEYQLSNQHFVKLGWSVLPVARIMSEIIEYQAKPAKPRLDWFNKHKLNGRMYYDDGSTIFVDFLADGSAEVFYPTGTVAIKFQRSQNRNYNTYTVSSPEGKDCMGLDRESQIVAVFDTMGNGAVFDEDGATRLSYNQIGGISRDNPSGVPFVWKWKPRQRRSITKIAHVEKPAMHLEKLLYSPAKSILKSSGSTKASSTSPASSRNKEKKVVEQKPVVKQYEEEEEVESGFGVSKTFHEDTFHFKPICLSINEFITLRIANRSNVSLNFLANKKTIRIELGTILNLNKKVNSYFVDSSSKDEMLKCKFEDLLPSRLKLDSSMQEIAEEFQKLKRSARRRKFMMNKYRPYLHAWKTAATRCHAR